MTRKRARGLMLELCRRLYLQDNGKLKGFGRMAKFYRDSWRDIESRYISGGYKGIWNCDLVVTLRESVGM